MAWPKLNGDEIIFHICVPFDGKIPINHYPFVQGLNRVTYIIDVKKSSHQMTRGCKTISSLVYDGIMMMKFRAECILLLYRIHIIVNCLRVRLYEVEEIHWTQSRYSSAYRHQSRGYRCYLLKWGKVGVHSGNLRRGYQHCHTSVKPK